MPVSVSLPYGNKTLSAQINDNCIVQNITIPKAQTEKSISSLLEDAMEHPIGSLPLEQRVKPDDTVVIVMNDHTRPGPNPLILDAIVQRLSVVGVPDENITVLFATGSHRAPTEEEAIRIMGEEYYHRIRSVAHDCLDDANMSYVGDTPTGMPIYVNRLAVECSFLITTGLIAPIHTAGFSGGRKSIVPGIAGLKTLHIHHSFPIYQYEPAMGFLEGNPFHEIALAAAKKVGVDFIVNAVQDPNKQFFKFVAGDLEQAHVAGVKDCRRVSEIEIPLWADIVIASPGGFPRDIDLYQSQKALSVSEVIGRPGCTFILVAECRDGFGENTFRQWMMEEPSVQSIIDRFASEGFNVGNNKAFNFARALKKGRVIVVTDQISADDLHAAKLECAKDLQTAIQMSTDRKPAKVITVMGSAANIIPKVLEPI